MTVNVTCAQGKDHTLYALKEGHVKFAYSKLARRRSVSVLPLSIEPVAQL